MTIFPSPAPFPRSQSGKVRRTDNLQVFRKSGEHGFRRESPLCINSDKEYPGKAPRYGERESN